MFYLKIFLTFLCFISAQARAHDHARPNPMQLINRIRGYKNQIFGNGNDIATGFNDVSWNTNSMVASLYLNYFRINYVSPSKDDFEDSQSALFYFHSPEHINNKFL